MSDILVCGIHLKVSNKFLCYNSFSASFYLGDKEHAELFDYFRRDSKLYQKAIKQFLVNSIKEVHALDGY